MAMIQFNSIWKTIARGEENFQEIFKLNVALEIVT